MLVTAFRKACDLVLSNEMWETEMPTCFWERRGILNTPAGIAVNFYVPSNLVPKCDTWGHEVSEHKD